MYIDGRRSGADSEDEAPGGPAVLRTRRLPRRRTSPGRADGRDRQGPWRPHPARARRRAAKARREGVRLRAGAAVRHLAAHAEPSPQEAARGRDRGLRAPRALGLLLRHPRRAEGALRMAELSDTELREHVRARYSDAALRMADRDATAGCGCGCETEDTAETCCTDSAGAVVFGGELYDDHDTIGATDAAVAASLGCGVPTTIRDLHAGETVLDPGSGAGAHVL